MAFSPEAVVALVRRLQEYCTDRGFRLYVDAGRVSIHDPQADSWRRFHTYEEAAALLVPPAPAQPVGPPRKTLVQRPRRADRSAEQFQRRQEYLKNAGRHAQARAERLGPSKDPGDGQRPHTARGT